MRLHQLVTDSAGRMPDAPAVVSTGGTLTYRQLDELADRYCDALRRRGVQPGDRVVVWSPKTPDAVALMQGALRCGAVYVPVADSNPAARVRRIVRSCAPAAVVTDNAPADRDGGEAEPWSAPVVGFGELLDGAAADGTPQAHPSEPDDPAYILYTSGSTGEPKGVCISHRNALAFIRWAAAEIQVSSDDRLSNHAPFNFDLSVFDLYAAFLAGASVYLVPEGLAYSPVQLVELMNAERISVWYSVPSVLTLMIQQGGLLDGDPPSALRACVFAGEAFPTHQVQKLLKAWPGIRLFNWYGPTETNVCTSYEVTDRDLGSTRPLPIGTAASGDYIALHPPGAREGEIVVSGPTVMLGYWGAAPQQGPYFTGDIGRRGADGSFEYVGRHDQMVKVRGHRIELGEIDSAVVDHPDVAEAATVVVGTGLEAAIHTVVVPAGASRPGLLDLKRQCAARLPTSMIVDALHIVAELPLTANGKTDRRALAAAIESGSLG